MEYANGVWSISVKNLTIGTGKVPWEDPKLQRLVNILGILAYVY